MINRVVWTYLIYHAIKVLAVDHETDHKGKIDLLNLSDTPKIQRFVHLIIDSVLCLITCSFVVNSVLTTNIQIQLQHAIGYASTTYIVFFICALMYYVFYETLFGFTPAKILTGSKVITIKGERISFSQGVLRTLSRRVPFASLAFLLGEYCPHDYWTDTRVIKIKSNKNRL
ncbi:MAG: RDD family protein [Cytophaga sp.]|uniref:RDD family protein n=1 Tax=Cytophaga sp. TaxID=29535 RepID=UPI003F7F8D74